MKKVFGLIVLIIAFQAYAQKTYPIASVSISLPAKPTVLLPDSSTVSEEDGKIINFNWKPVTPKPKEPVLYRVKAWQLMQGQMEADAIRMNRLMVVKDVIDQTQIVVENLVKIPCPNGCRFVWNVQALNRKGQPISVNKGFSPNGKFVIGVKMERK
ncbi:MAG TPA: hypothetical protein DIT07_12175 [Sphingobacteriaceae bacterium]|nr:hypothetical protein [Sphingobacteriaceae bacterium]